MSEFINQPKNILLIIDPQNDFTDIPETFSKITYISKDSTNPFDQTSESAGLPVGPATKEQNLYFAEDFPEDKKEPINGAKADLDKLVDFLKINGDKFHEIHVSLDSHTKNHIGHIGFWDIKSFENEKTKKQEIRPRPLQQFYVKPEGTDTDEPYKIYVKNFGEIHDKTQLITDEQKKKYEKEFIEVIAEPANKELKEWAYRYILKMQDLRKSNESKPVPCLWAEHCIRGENGWKVYKPLLDDIKLSSLALMTILLSS